ncbi:hypothetical protein LNP74_32735 [Klebsiella pneumoniae subsp. pneumoniae]|nr:hypothetical protein [Klebsiella pneumoniae subsp. pneumoniae]
MTDAYRDALLAQFPQARAHVIAGAGHWVHAEKPEAVLRAHPPLSRRASPPDWLKNMPDRAAECPRSLAQPFA